MKRSLNILLLLFILSQNYCVAQFKKQLDSLCVVCKKSQSDSDKVVALGKLANLYYTYKLNRQGDSVLHEQLLVAELSDNNNLILAALFGDAITNISPSATRESFDKTIQFLEKGIKYAKSQNQYEYTAIGYTRMANILRNRGQYDKGLYNANIASQLLPNIQSDSVKAVIYIELGNTYQAKGESVSACTNYNSAFDIAVTIKSVPLQSDIYHCFSEMYRVLNNNDVAIDELKKSLSLDKENKYGAGMIRDYYDLARLTDEKFYIDKSIQISDSLHFNRYLLDAKRLMLYYYMVAEKNSDKALSYLEKELDVKESFLNTGVAHYYRTKGQIYLYSNKADSALYYFKLVEYDFVKNFDESLSKNLFKEIAISYKLLNDIPNAISYDTKALALSKKMNDANSIASISASLSDLYELQGDYKQAFIFSKQSIEYKDSLAHLSSGRDIALLGVEREKRKHQEDIRQQEKQLNNKRNIQYMAISIAICIIFIGILVMGMFPVSKITIKMFGYFFFISLFEFIVLLIDNIFLSHATHNEPLKLWLIKIVLIALLVPLQHFLEHNLIRFLESRKLIEARTKLSLKVWRQKTKKPTIPEEADFEEDTAVL